MIKKLVLACALLLLPLTASADQPNITTYQLGDYTVSVEETSASLRVSALNKTPYGYVLQSSSNGNTTVDGQRVKRITVVFSTAPELNLKEPIKASETYSVRFSKGTVIQKVLLTIKTGNVATVSDQVVWDRSSPR